MLIEDTMDSRNLSQEPPRPTWRQMAAEHIAMELLEREEECRALQAQNADLASDNESLRLTLHSAVDGLRHVMRDRDELRRLLDHWIFEQRRTRRRDSSGQPEDVRKAAAA